MRIFLTGATGFIGGAVARVLRSRSDEVRALVRSPAKTRALTDLGVELVPGDVSNDDALRHGMAGVDAVIHAAAMYEVGIPGAKADEMRAINIGGTERVLRAAEDVEVSRIVHVSSMAAFGDTGGRAIDETFERSAPFASVYDETKHRSHEIAVDRARAGAPVVIVMPGGVYGPDDHSQLGNLVDQFLAGRLPVVVFAKGGVMVAHVDDVADGIVAALDRGKVGEAYILGGTPITTAELIRLLARITGRKPPRVTVPDGVMRAVAPLGPLVGPIMGFPPNFRELVAIGQATYWGTWDKAATELGYDPRPIEDVVRDTLRAEGRLR